jgi:hypothetical protein
METLLQQLNYQPHGLTPKEIREPETAIAYFFKNHPLHITRENIWQFYQSWICENANVVDAEKQKAMLFFYMSLNDLINLCYVVGFEEKQLKLN